MSVFLLLLILISQCNEVHVNSPDESDQQSFNMSTSEYSSANFKLSGKVYRRFAFISPINFYALYYFLLTKNITYIFIF